MENTKVIIFRDLKKVQQDLIYDYNSYIYDKKIYESKEYLKELLTYSYLSDVEKNEIKLYIIERKKII